MYNRNALLLHLPWSIIVDGWTCCRNRSIAKLVQIEWVPTLNTSKPSLALPIRVTTVFRWVDTSVAWICWSSPSPLLKTLMSVSSPVLGYDSIQAIIAAQAFTGQISFIDAC